MLIIEALFFIILLLFYYLLYYFKPHADLFSSGHSYRKGNMTPRSEQIVTFPFAYRRKLSTNIKAQPKVGNPAVSLPDLQPSGSALLPAKVCMYTCHW